MAQITVVINIPDVTIDDISPDSDWFDENGNMLVNKKYLQTLEDDDSIYVFDAVDISD